MSILRQKFLGVQRHQDLRSTSPETHRSQVEEFSQLYELYRQIRGLWKVLTKFSRLMAQLLPFIRGYISQIFIDTLCSPFEMSNDRSARPFFPWWAPLWTGASAYCFASSGHRIIATDTSSAADVSLHRNRPPFSPTARCIFFNMPSASCGCFVRLF